jgi:hypothetical protein
MATPDGTSPFGHVHAKDILVGSAGEVLMLENGGYVNLRAALHRPLRRGHSRCLR